MWPAVSRQPKEIYTMRPNTRVTIFLVPLLAPTAGFTQPLGDAVRVSGGSPFLDCVADFPDQQNSTHFPGSEVEPRLDVNSTDPNHLVVAWQQDRWNNGAARGQGVAVSFDGGLTWTAGPTPDLSRCTGGEWVRVSDPWVSFGPTGDLFQMALAQAPGRSAMTVQKSTDGGLTWTAPTVVVEDAPPLFNDKNALTADPTDPRFVYAVWDRVDFANGGGPVVLARSADGGESFEPARVIFDPGPAAQTIGNQIVVAPDGTVFNFFTLLQLSPLPPGSADRDVVRHPGGAAGGPGVVPG